MEERVSKKETPPPRYDETFKAGAVRTVTEQSREPRKIARDLGICIDTLRKQLGEKDEVIDILKKSVGILSKP